MNHGRFSPRGARARLEFFAFTLLAAGILSCGGGGDGSAQAPALDSINDQQVAVGEELVIELSATDEDSDALTYSVSSQSSGLTEAGELMTRPDGSSVFRWRPTAADVGSWFVDFTVSDGALEDTETIVVEVLQVAAGVAAPVFRAPLGAGTTLDLAKQECVAVDIVVEDPDTPQVAITQASTVIDQASLTIETGLSAQWSWCPTAAQLEDTDRYLLVLAADDLEHAPTTKNYLIVLRRRPKQDCPGEGPAIAHTPKDHGSPLDVVITAEVSDDIGIKREPILYYGLEDPVGGDGAVDFASLTPVTMALGSGDAKAGTWTATIPNPVVGEAEGASASVYYVISASDNDDAQGDCDHLTDAPESGAFVISVTNSGESGGAAPCAPCSADAQCGGAQDLCVHEPQHDAAFCAVACGEGKTCPDGYVCTEGVTSVDDVSLAQCRPASQSCLGPEPEQCVNDGYEPNNNRGDALAGPMLAEGSTNGLMSCPGDDDWYWFSAQDGTLIEAILDGGDASDLDLALYDIDGAQLEESAGLSSFEALERCVDAGGYFLRVSAAQLNNQENQYLLDLGLVAGECGPSCEDDDAEDDDSAAQARPVPLPDPYSSQGNAICSGDDDWYAVSLFSGELLDVQLSFTQSAPDEDLDLHFFNASLDDLTPCSEEEPWLCTSDQGQSGDSDEHYTFTTPGGCTPCEYYVVVRGWDGSENDYDIAITLPD
ncbi:MAG: hypothetical protein KC468_11225 [Myxococcales bacterium]|nr:hypothetical protein [Myxococcales bacterium]